MASLREMWTLIILMDIDRLAWRRNSSSYALYRRHGTDDDDNNNGFYRRARFLANAITCHCIASSFVLPSSLSCLSSFDSDAPFLPVFSFIMHLTMMYAPLALWIYRLYSSFWHSMLLLFPSDPADVPPSNTLMAFFTFVGLLYKCWLNNSSRYSAHIFECSKAGSIFCLL